MKDIWLESALEDIKKAEKKLEIGDYKNVCILSRISATKSIYSLLSQEENFKYVDNLEILFEKLKELNNGFRELEDDVSFLSRFILYEDVVTPYVIEKWLGLPTEEEAIRALSIAKALYEKFKSL
ncbi:MAG: HEPN domain-containing protein [Candidatus Hydrothermia bacterium]